MGGFGGFEGGQMAGLNAFKSRWLGHVAARVVASCLCQLPWKGQREGLEGLERLKAGKRQGWRPLKADGWGM